MGLFGAKKSAEPVEAEPDATPTEPGLAGPQRKSGPTPTRKEAEAARKARLNPSLSPKEARRKRAEASRTDRLRAMNVRENTPEKVLLRNYVDSRFRLGEILLPALVVILALSMLGTVWPSAVLLSTVVLYSFIIIVLFDIFMMWRGFKKVLAERLPRSHPRGLLRSGANRCIQIRRFRMPPPAIKRGEAY
ncbi:MAG: DUF3043 domain-containing protein [Propionibacteriales bacterium]|nr:DUF3043 domain-containing protein [Propionibacteriales bacterium]